MQTVILGSGTAAKSAFTTLLERVSPQEKVILVTKEKDLFYSRVLLPDYIAGHISQQRLHLVPDEIPEDRAVIKRNTEAIGLEPERRLIHLSNKEELVYDKLLIATGAAPTPWTDGNGLPEGVFYLRDLEDAEQIRRRAAKAGECVVLGGGLVSLKAAWALNQLGLTVKLLVSSSRLLSQISDALISQWVYNLFSNHGVDIELSAPATSFLTDAKGLRAVELADGRRIPAQLAVVGKGVRPNLGFAKGTSLRYDRGIIVDQYMKTSVPDIYAAGDVAQVKDLLSGGNGMFTLWPEATVQGRIAANSILGFCEKAHTGALSMNSVVFYGVPFIMVGKVKEKDIQGLDVYKHVDLENKVYRKIVCANGRLVGAVFGGNVTYAGMVYWDIKSQRQINSPEDYLSLEGLSKVYHSRGSEL